MVLDYWIKINVGLEGNERADQLAKEAALKSKKSIITTSACFIRQTGYSNTLAWRMV